MVYLKSAEFHALQNAIKAARVLDDASKKPLPESGGKYRRLFELSEDPMWLIFNNKFEICNDAAVNVLGYESQEELASTHPSALSPPIQPDGIDSFTKAEQMMAAALEKGYHRFEWEHRKKNGEDFPVEVTLTSIPHEDGVGIYCVWRDISARKQVEAELLEAKADADDANLAKSHFLALVGHELRSPLNAVIGFSDFLHSGALGPLNDKQQNSVNCILQGGKLLLNLVSDLLDYAKLESDVLDINLETLDPSETIDTAISFIQKDAEENGVSIHWENTSQKAEQPSLLYAKGDKLRLLQSILNLLSNAVKYNDAGGNIWISLQEAPATASERNKLTISIKDDGYGIKAKDFAEIFEPFNRGGQKGGNIEGTGLGLNVAKRLLKEMGGDITLESTWGKGTTFYLTLEKAS